ncbi:MAG TPA: ABC transporter permease [Vicinamibacterales bacterium]|nr:ABC transporter permease [Vicinamibacterales bacterium]
MRPFLRQTLVVVRKELKDSSRDRRAIFAMIFGILIGPAVIAFMVDRLIDRERQAEQVRLPVVGAEHAPAFVDWLRAQDGVEVVAAPADPNRAVRDGSEDVVLVIADDFADRFRRVRAASVDVVSDRSREASRPKVTRVKELLTRYSSEIGALRLVARGVSPEVASTLKVNEIDVSTAQERAATILNFLGLFMLVSSLLGGMQLATDSTAGERERSSLEPLLVNPVPRAALVAGKWLAAAIASMVAVVFTMTFCILLLKRVLAPDIGIRVSIGPPQMVNMLIAALSICPLAAAVQACMGIYSRSFKEAQSYMGILTTIPVMAIAVVSSLYPLSSQPWMYAVPMLSQYMLVKSVIGGATPSVTAFVITTTVSLALTALLLVLMTRLFRSERIIFGR